MGVPFIFLVFRYLSKIGVVCYNRVVELYAYIIKFRTPHNKTKATTAWRYNVKDNSFVTRVKRSIPNKPCNGEGFARHSQNKATKLL